MGGMAVVLGGVLLLGASAATAYEPHELGEHEFRYEMAINSALDRYVAPSVACPFKGIKVFRPASL